MKHIYKIFAIGLLCSASTLSLSQAQFWRINGNNNTNPINNYLGTSTNDGLSIRTFGTERIRINPSAGATAGFVGINENNPLFRLHVRGSGQATSQGWIRGIMMSDRSALMWHGAPNTNRHYFMGHSSNNPFGGNFFQGFAEGVGAGAPVTYASTVFVTTNPSNGPDGSTENR